MSFDPEAEGWKHVARSGFSGHVGPIWTRREGEGWAYGFLADERHGNPRGFVHGGMLMTFADHFMGFLSWEASQKPSVTIQLNTHFLDPARPGDFVEGRGEVVRRTRSVNFMRGWLTVGDRQVAAMDGIWKIMGAP